ncbi:hypothetical protein Vretimale_18785, partial [Volvox reticuliferus]
MHKLWRIQGAGGHGKSHTLRAFIAKATSMGKRVIVCATTAKASKLLGDGACTVHMAFGFTGPSWIPLTNPNILMYIDLADVIVIDEVSMAKADLLQEVHQRCIDASPNSTEPFAGKFVILGGDKHQLPAVCDRRCNEASCIHQPYRWAMWPHFREIVLQKNYRQHADSISWISCLNKIRVSVPGDAELALLQTRVAGNEWVAPKNAVFLAGTNEEVAKFNEEAAHAHFPEANLVTILAEDEVERSNRFSTQDLTYLKRIMEDKGVLPEKLLLAPGMVVMCTQNLKYPNIDNGTLAEVVAIETTHIHIRVLGTNCEVNIPHIIDSKYHNRIRLKRKMYPLVVAFARTVHKVQGDTIRDPVVIDFTNMSRLGQAYVALSRIVSIDQLHILPRGITLTSDMFQPHVPDDGD